MDLIVNGTALTRSSLGARRYCMSIMNELAWPGAVEVSVPCTGRTARFRELFDRGRRDAIFWSPAQQGSIVARNHVVTILDCINVEYVYRDDWRLPILRTVTGTLMARAKRVVCISHATRTAVLRNYSIDPAKVVAFPGPVVVPNPLGVVRSSTRPTTADFVLMITNTLPHKNTRRAGEAFAASSAARRGIKLRVVGKLDDAGLAACHTAGCDVEQHRNVPDTLLAEWLTTCRFLWAPSLEEGLDLPIAEALACGANVLCSDIAVHREFYAGDTTMFDPHDRAAMTAALEDAFDRVGQWHEASATPRPTVADVAAQYRELFLNIAAESR
jgi:glycosyltransferase involved in cell wall biosynthesis